MLVDVLILILFLSTLMRGRETGFIRQACSATGFFGGLFLGALLRPHVIHFAHTPLTRLAMTVAVTLGCATLLLTVGEYVGASLKTKLLRHKINRADVTLGAVSGGLTLLLAVWLSAPAVEALPYQSLRQAVHNSFVVKQLDRALPSPPNLIARLGQVIDPNGFPQVFAGLEPKPNTDTPLPDLGELNAAVQKDRESVVKIEGKGCGGIVEGSGFVSSTGFVATNAHVVAGVHHPVVLDANGEHSATPVWFDPDLDLAVLRVDNLAGKPLTLNSSRAATGTPGAVLGYPGGGGFTAGPAAVLDEFIASGRNIYGQGNTNRDVYELKATIRPGNSGGPLVAKDGSVIGVVFAESTTYNQVGYALAMQQVALELQQAETRNTPVSTSACTEE